MQADKNNSRKGGYIETLTGIKFYPLDPRPDDFSLEDICHAVSREQRFGNHTEARYSVGQHLLMCAKFAKDMGFSPYVQFLCATHDLPEAYVRDLPRPIKQSFSKYQNMEKRILRVLWHEYFGIRKPTKEEISQLKFCDNSVLMSEAFELGINKTDWVNVSEIVGGYVDHSEPTDQEVRDSLKILIMKLLEQLKGGGSHASKHDRPSH
ncbi:hypothetical protein DNHGIG_25630 [Collibacillus ludicampi]|uniref:Phosphohydrolase n=1 Tax=Collibacillus ludicampi TaxID=2771369 RepID=A0AAV4LH38_9BACL|nr:hypothetical protein [Collibacillus ludicampi]GIM47014.1 hypothetical protein DNHGIG_25630 [Collibacillus ludicampi]